MSDFRPWTVLHLDLAAELPALELAPGCGGIYAVYWWRDTPLGHSEISRELLPMPPYRLADFIADALAPVFLKPSGEADDVAGDRWHQVQLGRLARASTSLEERQPAPLPVETSDVSVVICTRNRPELLQRCLASLQRLDPPAGEILVVDNAPDDGSTRQIVQNMPGVRYVLEPAAGLNRARNAGVLAARGEIIAFTDDDVEVHRHWVGRVKQCFLDPAVAAMTGLALTAQLEHEQQMAFERHWGFNRGYCRVDYGQRFFEQYLRCGVPTWDIGAGANMAFRRESLEEAGPFDQSIGVGASGCAGDSEMWYRLLAAGFNCRYEPAAVVFHHHRVDEQTYRHQLHHYMKGHVAALLVQAERYRHPGNLYRLGVILPRYYLRQMLRRLYWGIATDGRTWFTEVGGCLAGIGYYLRHCCGRVQRRLQFAPRQDRDGTGPAGAGQEVIDGCPENTERVYS